MRLFSWASLFVFAGSMAAADCADFLRRLNDPERATRICAMEDHMPFEIRGRWINKRFVAFANAARFEGATKVQQVGIVDSDGRPFQTASDAATGVYWFEKTARCEVADVSADPGQITTLRMICPVEN